MQEKFDGPAVLLQKTGTESSITAGL